MKRVACCLVGPVEIVCTIELTLSDETRVTRAISHIFTGFDTSDADPVQPLTTACEELRHLDRYLSGASNVPILRMI